MDAISVGTRVAKIFPVPIPVEKASSLGIVQASSDEGEDGIAIPAWFEGSVIRVDNESGKLLCSYDDGDEEWLEVRSPTYFFASK